MIYQFLIATALASMASAALYTEDPQHLKQLWENFKKDFGRSYQTMDEENFRFSTFVQNLRDIDARNKAEKDAGGNAYHGITKFADMSQAEFEAKFLTADPTMKVGTGAVDTTEGTVDAAAGLVDWTGTYTTPVKDQGYCGSCWAFSATEQIESDSMRALKKSWVLSPQQITSCDTRSSGCNGGFTEYAYDYVKKAGGLEQNSDYPYTSYQGTTGKCNANSAKYVVAVSGYTTIKGETNMASYVQKTGPLSICVDASSWNSYTGGIMKTCGKRTNHCVQAVGVDASTSGYWKVRNSWGTSWGEKGFIRLAYGQNTCNLTDDPTWVSVSAK